MLLQKRSDEILGTRGVFASLRAIAAEVVTPDFTSKTECISYVRQDHLHTHDRQNESNTIAVIKRTRV
jgi:hypothetical protein